MDGQTDSFLIVSPRWHSMQRGKNILVSFFLDTLYNVHDIKPCYITVL